MTTERAPSPALRWIGAVLAGLGFGGAAAYALTQVLGPAGSGMAGAWQTAPAATAAIVAAPIVAALLAAAFGGGSASAPHAPAAAVAAVPSAPPPPDRGETALRLLALLQQEGRLVDFLEEDLGPYSDTQIGSAVRAIHSGCRNVLKERLELAPILPGTEGATVTVERGFDPAAVRVTGNVRGEPPYHGVLRHAGWRSATFRMPDSMGDRDHTILAPAEVEVL
jgi:MFS family permease